MLTAEVKGMSRIFSENQKVLVSMKSMIDGLAGAVEALQNNSRQVRAIEEDAQKLFAGLEGVRARSDAITGLEDQASRLNDRIEAIESRAREAAGTEEVSRKVSDSMDSIKNNTMMLIKIAGRVDEVGEGLREVSARTEAVLAAGREMEEIKKGLWILGERTKRMEADAGEAKADIETAVRDGLRVISDRAAAAVGAEARAAAAGAPAARDQVAVQAAPWAGEQGRAGESAGKIRARSDAGAPQAGQADDMAGQATSIESAVGALAERAGRSEGAEKEAARAVESGFARLGKDMADKAEAMERRASALADAVARAEASASEIHAKVDEALDQLRGLKEAQDSPAAAGGGGGATADIMAMLRLSEYHSEMRMRAESKYGGAQDLAAMATRTAEMAKILDENSAGAGGGGGRPPHEVRQWAVSKILECADRWDVRFSDVLEILSSSIGDDVLREAVRVQQVKDIYGARAAGELRTKLGIAEKGQGR